MKYFKIIKNNSIVAVCCSIDFRRYNCISKLLLNASEDNGEFVRKNGTLYHDVWMPVIPADKADSYETATITEIEEKLYNELKETLDSVDSIEIEDNQAGGITPAYVPISVDPTLEQVQELKILQTSAACNQAIEQGFDIILSDGEVHHFSLTTQDQLNLISLSGMAANGMAAIPYHADGEICKFYSNADIVAIVDQATKYKIYHTTYYNALKNYINNLNDIDAIAAIHYGDVLPEKYQSEVLKTLQ